MLVGPFHPNRITEYVDCSGACLIGEGCMRKGLTRRVLGSLAVPTI